MSNLTILLEKFNKKILVNFKNYLIRNFLVFFLWFKIYLNDTFDKILFYKTIKLIRTTDKSNKMFVNKGVASESDER